LTHSKQKENYEIRKENYEIRKENYEIRKENYEIRKENYEIRKENYEIRTRYETNNSHQYMCYYCVSFINNVDCNKDSQFPVEKLC